MNNTATTTYTFMPTAGQCATTPATMTIVVNPIAAVFSPVAPICSGAILANLPTTSNNGVTGTWSPAMDNTATTTYTFMPAAGQCTTTPATMTIVVNPIAAVFSPVAPICSGAILANLPTTSNNGVTGTWSPAMNSTATTTYTFMPTAGQCATTPATMTIVVNPIAAVFSPVAPICSGAILANLPTTSNNGVTGTWSPAMDNTATTTYTFMPTAGQCATTPTTLTIVVNPNATPTFTAIAPICSGSTTPVLPTTSNNLITGTWNPATVSNTNSATYYFTPNSGQCALPTTLDVTIILKIVPSFDPIADVCYGSAAPSLPTTSTNGITGTWNPAIVSNLTSGTYTFTPTDGICATTATLIINVNTITPIFNAFAPICANTTAPILSPTSTNGISGTWNPATIANTASGTYTFTPATGQCAATTTLNVTVNQIVTASFTAIPPICSGTPRPVLPLTSNNLITGIWSPPTVSNTVSGTYIFTPTDGQCAIGTTLDVTVNPNITPTFTNIAPLCSGSTAPVLPSTSTNSISGTWNPATVSNTASGTYTFTPTDGQCALVTYLSVVVNSSPTDIVFTTTDVVNDGPDGIIEITGVTSGVAPFQYSINNSSFTTDTTYSGLLPGNYTITVRDSNGCEFNKAAKINSLCLFPNAITPNNDSFNDTFNLKGCDVVKLELYNRYGVEVNRYNNYSDQWDGTNENGKSLPDGTYFYVAEIADGTSKSGWVFVTR
jgi:gliding motility-associated-like protein